MCPHATKGHLHLPGRVHQQLLRGTLDPDGDRTVVMTRSCDVRLVMSRNIVPGSVIRLRDGDWFVISNIRWTNQSSGELSRREMLVLLVNSNDQTVKGTIMSRFFPTESVLLDVMLGFEA